MWARVRLQVRDLDVSAEYYRRVIGSRLAVAWATTRRSALATTARLSVLQAKSGVHPVPARVYTACTLRCASAGARSTRTICGNLSRLGIRHGMADHCVSESLYLTDPDGLGIEVYASTVARHVGPQRPGNRHVTAATEQCESMLPVGSVSGRRAPGTSVGHRHLHVGTLPKRALLPRGSWIRQTLWSIRARCSSRRAVPPSSRDEHLVAWTRRPMIRPGYWIGNWWCRTRTVLRTPAAVCTMRAMKLRRQPDGWIAMDPWGTQLRIVVR